MMNSLVYSIQEAFDGFRRARVSTFMTIFTISFLLFIITLFSILFLNADRLVNTLHAEYDIQAFISNTYSEEEVESLRQRVMRLEEIGEVEYVSKKQAAIEFQQEFGDEFFDILEENPLPASLIVKLKQEHQNVNNVKSISAKIAEWEGIDETVHSVTGFDLLIKVSNSARVALVVLLTIVVLGSMFVVSNTIRLIINARRHIIETMELVGATHAFIRRPYLLEGLFQGFLGGTFAAIIVFILLQIVDAQWPNLIWMPATYLLGLVAAGVIFGFLGSLFAVKRFL